MLQAIKTFFRERGIAKRNEVIRSAFADKRVLSSFIAKDVRREIKLVDIEEIESGFVVAQIRTNNILYMCNKLADEQHFSEPQRIAIDKIWEWTGQSWGGLPDGTSIADGVQSDSPSPLNDG
ncbi:hypothetical protein CA13_73590 [Planctomycetes bacterium CA13]|uniref:Uncharacterized protein n=2 Tax=Novipirellula herctigrandis TaxID=2527986 RepID=A0A5C5YLR5_9BACT|nr:hypothetical protein CA13_73590 [Planctomycetes bacterium CA13]